MTSSVPSRILKLPGPFYAFVFAGAPIDPGLFRRAELPRDRFLNGHSWFACDNQARWTDRGYKDYHDHLARGGIMQSAGFIPHANQIDNELGYCKSEVCYEWLLEFSDRD